MLDFFKYMEWKEQTEDRLAKYYKLKSNVWLKYAALVSIGISMLLMLAIIIFMDDIDDTTYLLMRGFAGVFAIVFIVLVGILVYRVNAAYYKDKSNKVIGNHRNNWLGGNIKKD